MDLLVDCGREWRFLIPAASWVPPSVVYNQQWLGFEDER
jgi:hypothetical protein